MQSKWSAAVAYRKHLKQKRNRTMMVRQQSYLINVFNIRKGKHAFPFADVDTSIILLFYCIQSHVVCRITLPTNRFLFQRVYIQTLQWLPYLNQIIVNEVKRASRKGGNSLSGLCPRKQSLQEKNTIRQTQHEYLIYLQA